MSDERTALSYVVPEGVTKVRADKVVASHFTEWSRALIQTIFEEGAVKLEGRAIKKNTKVSTGDSLSLLTPYLPEISIKPVDIPLEILFEDEHVVIINKESGIVTHPGKGTGEDTLVHALLHHTGEQLSKAAGEERLGVVHRLDKGTSGAMIFAKTDEAYFRLVEQFSQREVHKEYLAVVSRVPQLESGSLKKPIERHPVNPLKMMAHLTKGKAAHTDWRIEERLGDKHALIRCRLHTGRTHQIRVHLSDMGHPIVGDSLYGYRSQRGESALFQSRVFLHAEKLALSHPITREPLDLKAVLPADFQELIRVIRP